MNHWLLLLLATAGFGLLCLSRERHQSDLIGRKLGAGIKGLARWGGISSLALAFFIAGHHLGWGVGTLEWLGLSSVGAALTMAILSRRMGRKSSRR